MHDDRHHEELTKAMSAVYLGMGIIGVLVGITIHHLSFSWSGSWTQSVAVILLGSGTLICASLFLESAFPEFRVIEQQISALFSRFSWPLIVYFAAIAAVGEECFLRLALQPWTGLFFASVIYALFNFDGHRLLWTLWMFAASLLLGWIYEQTDQVLVTVVIHFLVNLFGLSRMKIVGNKLA